MICEHISCCFYLKSTQIFFCRPDFIEIDGFHTSLENFHASLKPRAEIDNEVMTLYLKTFNYDQSVKKKKPKNFVFSVLMSVSVQICFFSICLFQCFFDLSYSCGLPSNIFVLFCDFLHQLKLSAEPDVFDPKVCEKEFKNACLQNHISKSDLVSSYLVPSCILFLFFYIFF